VNFNPPIIFITSNYHYLEWYDGRKFPLQAMTRRIDYLVKVANHSLPGKGDGPWSEVACNTDGNFGPASPIPTILDGGKEVLLEYMMDIVDVPGYPRQEQMEDLVSDVGGDGEVEGEDNPKSFSPVSPPFTP
jgi:hypothetical protein